MLPSEHLAAFLATVYVLILIPGPSVLFIVSRAVSLGRRAALLTVLGNTGGLLLQLSLVTLRLGSLLASSQTASAIIRLLGAAYLIILGLRSIRGARTPHVTVPEPAITGSVKNTIRVLREGLLVGATNPKGLVILTAILPAFIDRNQGHETLQLVSMGLIVATLAMLSDSLWAVGSGAVRHRLRSARALRTTGSVGGLVMIVLGLAVASTARSA